MMPATLADAFDALDRCRADGPIDVLRTYEAAAAARAARATRRPAKPLHIPAGIAVQGIEYPDAVELARRWRRPVGDDRTLHVVGLSTGGAYLAPVLAAALRRDRATTEIVRPGAQLLRLAARPRPERDRVLLVDDPPATGMTYEPWWTGYGTPPPWKS